MTDDEDNEAFVQLQVPMSAHSPGIMPPLMQVDSSNTLDLTICLVAPMTLQSRLMQLLALISMQLPLQLPFDSSCSLLWSLVRLAAASVLFCDSY